MKSSASRRPSLVVRAAEGERTGNEQFTLTEDSEIKLDGQDCKYRDIPPGATIILLDVAIDGRTIRRIHFRTGK